MNLKPTIWVIGGTDNTQGAGIGSDILTGHDFNVHTATIISCVFAQNHQKVLRKVPVSSVTFGAQWEVLAEMGMPKAIKIGALGSVKIIERLSEYLKQIKLPIICDPIKAASSGKSFLSKKAIASLKELIFPHVTLLTPNSLESENLTGLKIKRDEDVAKSAQRLLAMGVKAVLIKGGHFIHCGFDYFTDGKEGNWLYGNTLLDVKVRGTGCAFSTAVASAIALNYSLKESIIVAKMYLENGLRTADLQPHGNYLGRSAFPKSVLDLPKVDRILVKFSFKFPREKKLGFYPIVDQLDLLKTLISLGVSTIQFRLKGNDPTVREKIKNAISIAKSAGIKLFINDHWELAIEYGAYGVHLGQEDLEKADVQAIYKAGLRLGISTHSLFELARAHAVCPSYVAFGPIYPTNTKQMPYAPQGLDRLRNFLKIAPYPVVAIGGINDLNLQAVLSTGVKNVAVISAVTQAKNIKETVGYFLQKINKTKAQGESILEVGRDEEVSL